jgi:hypothetical protein
MDEILECLRKNKTILNFMKLFSGVSSVVFSGPRACQAGTLLLKVCLQIFLLLVNFQINSCILPSRPGLWYFNLHLPHSWMKTCTTTPSFYWLRWGSLKNFAWSALAAWSHQFHSLGITGESLYLASMKYIYTYIYTFIYLFI